MNFILGVKEFCAWIDEYKKKNNWDDLFNTRQSLYPALEANAPKFHDLPIAFQIGIWIEFVCDRGGCSWEIEDIFTHDWRKDIIDYCRCIHEEKEFSNMLKK